MNLIKKQKIYKIKLLKIQNNNKIKNLKILTKKFKTFNKIKLLIKLIWKISFKNYNLNNKNKNNKLLKKLMINLKILFKTRKMDKIV